MGADCAFAAGRQCEARVKYTFPYIAFLSGAPTSLVKGGPGMLSSGYGLRSLELPSR
jgi:hypothetical protein